MVGGNVSASRETGEIMISCRIVPLPPSLGASESAAGDQLSSLVKSLRDASSALSLKISVFSTPKTTFNQPGIIGNTRRDRRSFILNNPSFPPFLAGIPSYSLYSFIPSSSYDQPPTSRYGLLGPSGCGKSTLLNAIVGLVGLESGDITTLMKSKRDLGFMPQQLALYDRMTTEETLNYFGNIYGMSEEEINKRAAHLIDFLEIPTTNRDNSSLSGGQKRRLSLAAALIHNPPLVVLDEPTVGVDPVLRNSIWDYLVNMAENEKKTVVITTHYIEETRQAHMIGLMRSGVLLCEDSPDNLLAQNNSGSLEETFMRLSHLQEVHKMKNDEEDAELRKATFKKPSKPSYMKSGNFFNSGRFKAEVTKNFKFIKRDYGVALYSIMVPLMSLICFNFGTGYEPKPFNLGVINEEFPEGVKACQSWRPNATCDFSLLSCRYLQKLDDKQVISNDIASMEEGLDLVRRSTLWGVIHFPHNYSDAMAKMTEVLPFRHDPENDFIIKYSTIDIRMDESNIVVTQLLKRDLYEGLKEVMEDMYVECGFEPRSAQLPLKFEEPVYARYNVDTRDYMAPTLISILMFTMPMAYGVVIIMEERQSGATARSVVAGVTPLELMGSHLIVQISIHFLQLISSSFLMYALLQYDFRNPLVALSLLFCLGFPGIAFSFFLPLVMNSTLAAGTVCTGFVIANVMVGGTMWPVEGVHPILQPVSWILPTYFPTAALRNANFKGWGLSEPSILFGFAASLGWTIVFVLAISTVIFVTKNRVFLGKNAP
uniref:ABC transporter G family member 23 n=1 Tax=Lygus hesperus TaxID=30085 RepID=A0A0A9W5Y2_LYGHE